MEPTFCFTRKQDIISWIEAKNQEISSTSHEAKLTCTTSFLKAFLSALGKKYVPIQTKEGPIWISRNAFRYLSVAERETHLPKIDLLILHMLAENKLKDLESSNLARSLTKNEMKALNSFLGIFGLTLDVERHNHETPTLSIQSLLDQRGQDEFSLGSSTPEFVVKLVDQMKKAREESTLPTRESLLLAEPETPLDVLHAIQSEFGMNPRKESIPKVVSAFLLDESSRENLSLRKWVKKVATHLEETPEKKIRLFQTLLQEYERQGQQIQNAPGLSFEEFAQAVFDEFFGIHNEKHGGRYYLNSVLSIRAIYSSQPGHSREVLSPHMKEAIQFYLLLHPRQTVGSSDKISLLLKALDEEYVKIGKGNLWEVMVRDSTQTE